MNTTWLTVHICYAKLEYLSNIEMGNARSGGPSRYLGRRAIFPTQTLRAAGICVFSTQTSEGDLDENCNLQKAKSRAP